MDEDDCEESGPKDHGHVQSDDSTGQRDDQTGQNDVHEDDPVKRFERMTTMVQYKMTTWVQQRVLLLLFCRASIV
ncbi:hypothetical protein Hdeb2414_s0001g00003351 [Helianthus debilis subsp. tardiflorus]